MAVNADFAGKTAKFPQPKILELQEFLVILWISEFLVISWISEQKLQELLEVSWIYGFLIPKLLVFLANSWTSYPKLQESLVISRISDLWAEGVVERKQLCNHNVQVITMCKS